jgi:hypothetical protein
MQKARAGSQLARRPAHCCCEDTACDACQLKLNLPNREEVKMAEEQAKKPDHLKVVAEEELDEEEKEFRALRRDVPGVKGASDVGLISVSVGRQPTPKNEFYRTHKEFRPIVPMVNVEAGMDRHYIAVAPHMVEPLASIGITVTDHSLYLIVTPRGGLRIIPVIGPNTEGEQNEWARTKEVALIDGFDEWVRMYTDLENGAYKSFPAPVGRFGEPKWPEIKPAKIFRMGFRDKGRLLDSTEHVLFQKWAGRDRG